jgi:hypothetical protein
VSPAESPVAAFQEADGGSGEQVYQGVWLITDDPDKLIPFVDQVLFLLRVQGFKTRPVAIRESQGVVEVRWTGRKPKALRDRLLAVSACGETWIAFR